MSERTSYTIDELSASVGIPVRTIRFYVAEGLLPGPGARGKAAAYSEEHLLRLRLIRRLVEERVPLAEIRGRLDRLTIADLRGLLAAEDRRSVTLERAAQRSPKDYIAALLDQARAGQRPPPASPAALTPVSTRPTEPPMAVPPRPRVDIGGDVWRRIRLRPGIELHVRGDVERQATRLIERIVEWARSSGSSPDEESDLDLDNSRQE